MHIAETTEFANMAVQATTISDSDQIVREGIETIQMSAGAIVMPSYSPDSPYVQTIVSASLADFFVSALPTDDDRLCAVFWQFEGPTLRVCTIVSTDDFEFERRIYDAELKFLDRFPKVQTDFYVIFRQERSLADLRPSGATQAFPPTPLRW